MHYWFFALIKRKVAYYKFKNIEVKANKYKVNGPYPILDF